MMESNLEKSVQKACQAETKAIVKHMKRLGGSIEQQNLWQQGVLDEIYDCFKMIKKEFEDQERQVEEEIIVLLQQSEDLCKKLHVPIPAYGSANRPLFEERDIVKRHVKEFEAQLEDKLKLVKKLHAQESKLCQFLGLDPIIKMDGYVPTPEKINEYELHVENLEELKFQRNEEFICLKEELLNYASELKYKPRLDFEKKILDTNEVYGSEEKINELKIFKDTLKEQYLSASSKVEELMNKLKRFWEILEVGIDLETRFINKLPKCMIDKLKVLEAEVKIYDAKVKKNIETIVQKQRSEIVNLWNMCRYTAEDQQKFIYFKEEHYCEDLIEHHELEISKLKNYYETHKDIFSLIEKHDILWDQKLELEKTSSSQDRYKNRGGKLLQEEKQRNAVLKQLASVENKLRSILAQYDRENRPRILIFGSTVEDYIERAYEELEKEKKIKLSAKKEMAKSSQSIASSRFGSTLNLRTPNAKRKLLTPRTSPNKRSKLTVATPSQKARPARNALTVPKILVTKSGNSSLRKSFENKRSHARKLMQSKSSLDTTPDYEDFENALQKQKNCRSTQRFKPLNAENNNVHRLKTPLRVAPTALKQLKF